MNEGVVDNENFSGLHKQIFPGTNLWLIDSRISPRCQICWCLSLLQNRIQHLHLIYTHTSVHFKLFFFTYNTESIENAILIVPVYDLMHVRNTVHVQKRTILLPNVILLWLVGFMDTNHTHVEDWLYHLFNCSIYIIAPESLVITSKMRKS